MLIGNSFGGSAAVLAAADRPDLVAGLVLLSPFLREPASAGRLRMNRLLFRLLFARPWGVAVLDPLLRGHAEPRHPPPPGSRRTSPRSRPRCASPAGSPPSGHLTRAARPLGRRAPGERRAAPALIAVGALDPDYADPAAELRWMGERLAAQTLLVPEAAHYAHTQRPDLVLPAIAAFAEGLRDGSGWRAAGA